MLNFIFIVAMLIVFGKLLGVAISATWGVARILFSIVLLPLFLVGLVLQGLLAIAFPILILVGLASLIVAD